ncbi:MAG: ABC transporter ATP-binding protein [Blautia sp.]|uniref:amino acid ABC transporter ATP-binding/permease protein n=1 Tax=Blautia sp. TaxID=1955243 RepID=UPI002E77D331|nr:ABC transporter ATP-binding protein [Blautia sp.]MEE1442345.1 ABC transporter ATP-binding protein [Blautia sp.]
MKKRNHWKLMLQLSGLVKPLSGYMVLAVLMGLAGHLCATFITVFAGFAMLAGLGEPVPVSISVLFLAMGGFALMRGILRYGEQACNHFIAFKLLALIRDKVFCALRRLCPAKLEGKEKGSLISVITSDIELLEVFYAHTISPALIALLFCTGICLFLGSYHPVLGILAFASFLIVGVFIPMAVSKLNGWAGMRFRTMSGDLSSFVLDSLRGLPEILQYHAGDRRRKEMNERTEALSAEEGKMKKLSGWNTAVTNSMIWVADLVMLFTSAWLFQRGIVEFEGVVIPTVTLMSSFGPVVALAALGSTLQNTFAAGNRVLDILEEIPVTEEIQGKETIEFTGAKAEKVSFSYGNEEILHEVSLEIPKNKIIGIQGKSGSGKSTLLKLFMRFWQAREGEVEISGHSVNEVNTTNLRDMESFMTQETHLFHDSIASNLRIAKPEASMEELENACRKASIHDFIMSLPKGYETPVGELGDTLSGGERQRLGLARAFLHDAPFMLLDEPTSNLDSLNEAVILKSLHKQRKGKTVILVSHRKSTMGITDKIYSVEHGRMS